MINDILIYHTKAPLNASNCNEIEALLVNIFEYGDYSFRDCLAGKFDGIEAIYGIAKKQDKIIAVAIALLSKSDRNVALLGPVAVKKNYQKIGIGQHLLQNFLGHLQHEINTKAIYLGVKQNNPAAKLYKKMGFETITGIVMRKIFAPDFEKAYFRYDHNITIETAGEKHWPSFHALIATPCNIICADYLEGIFSSKYCPVERFASVFPLMLKQQTQGKRFIKVLAVRSCVMALGSLTKTGSLSNSLVLDFTAHNNFQVHLPLLIESLLKQAVEKNIFIYCPQADTIKLSIIKSLNSRCVGILPGALSINNQPCNVAVYQISI